MTEALSLALIPVTLPGCSLRDECGRRSVDGAEGPFSGQRLPQRPADLRGDTAVPPRLLHLPRPLRPHLGLEAPAGAEEELLPEPQILPEERHQREPVRGERIRPDLSGSCRLFGRSPHPPLCTCAPRHCLHSPIARIWKDPPLALAAIVAPFLFLSPSPPRSIRKARRMQVSNDDTFAEISTSPIRSTSLHQSGKAGAPRLVGRGG